MASALLKDLSHFQVVGIAAALVVTAFVLSRLYSASTSPLRSLPGPWLSHFTNQQLKSAVTGGRRIFYIDQLHKKYGPVVRISPDEVAIYDVEGFRKIHAVSGGFTKGDFYTKLTNFPRHSVFTLRDPKSHGVRRRLFARGFSKTYLRDNWEKIVREKVQLCVDKISGDAKKHGGKVDIFEWWSLMGADIVGCLCFGESFGMLELGHRSEYIRILELALVGNGIGAEHPWMRAVLSRLPIKPLKEMFNSTNYVLSHGLVAVENAKKAKEEGRDTNLMVTVIKESEQEGGGKAALDDIDVQVEATSLIFAGSGTTANTLTFIIWNILSRPELRRSLEKELSTLPEDFKDADLEALPLLNAVINETLRLYAAVPGSLPRVVPASGVTIAGHYLPPGTTVSTQAWTYHRDERLYSNPLEFNPSRFLDDVSGSTADPKAARATNSAFGAGAYTCLGIHLAYMELRYGVAMFMIQCRNTTLAEGQPALDEKQLVNYFVITPKAKKLMVQVGRPTLDRSPSSLV
ncbi:cytochrome P450 [Polychaeton citri CBS 116435]|uniref:Cytochrome P450 n=1 Tax=Polychaeton citri CBS 116435 TaxID=1314669 RepID=A0A9P4UMW1_9PEZI|nr:cytochrome P450 [Polychaeton citri CBS 116435]